MNLPDPHPRPPLDSTRGETDRSSEHRADADDGDNPIELASPPCYLAEFDSPDSDEALPFGEDY